MKPLKLLFTAALCGMFGGAMAQEASVETPNELYIIGGVFNGNKNDKEFPTEWRKADALALENAGEGVFYYRGFIGSNLTNGGQPFGPLYNQFKFVLDGTDNGKWDGYHPKGTNQEIGQASVGQAYQMTTDGTGDYQWYVASDGSSDGYYELKIDTKAMTFTVENYKKAETEFTVGLFLIGGPFIEGDLNWSTRVDAVRMERDAVNPDVFHYRGVLEYNLYGVEPGNFKILVNGRNEWTDELVASDAGSASMLDLKEQEQGGKVVRRINGNAADTKWFIPEDGSGNGYWDFTVDAKNLTIKVNEFIPAPDCFTEMYLSGTAFGGWDENNPAYWRSMTKTASGVFEWTGEVKEGAFKVLRQQEYWAPSYMGAVADDPITLGEAKKMTFVKNYTVPESGQDCPFAIQAGNVTITVNLNTMELLVVEAANPGTGVESTEALQAAVYARNGQVHIAGVAGEAYTVQVFSLDGSRVQTANCSGSMEMALPAGAYIVSLTDAAGSTVNTKVVL